MSISLEPIALNASRIRADIQTLQAQLSEWRRYLHQRPELGFQEHLTAEFVSQQLSVWGIEHQTGIAGTGIVALLTGHAPGRVLAIRADMDALPIQEDNPVPYRSQHDGRMHACGHDGHTAIALGTAYYLAHHPEQFTGQVKIIFQPAEEGPGGAQPMIEAGVLRQPEVEAIIGLHLWNNLPLGTIGLREGALMAAVELFELTLQGKGGHGAMPHQTIDAILLGAQIVNALQAVVARNLDPLQAGVVTVGEFQAGHANNVIADKARLSGTVRYFDPALDGFFQRQIDRIVGGICQSHGATYRLDYQALYPPVVNQREITNLVRAVAETVIETPLGIVPNCQTMGGEDMSFFLQAVPGCYFFLGSANLNKGLTYPHHHPRFDFDETALGIGVELFLRCVERFCASA